MKANFPISFDDIRGWSGSHGVTESEGRIRFAQYGILLAISLSRELSRLLVFKGGNAIDFVWQPNRSTTDLDFSVDMSQDTTRVNTEVLRSLLDTALFRAGRTLNLRYRTQHLKPNPAGEDRTFVTYQAKIAYAFQDQASVIETIQQGRPAPHVIDLDISMNDVICASEYISLTGSRRLRTCTIEDIVAEKLRALLQQPIRRRNRAQDLLDIAVCLRQDARGAIDAGKVGLFLLHKADARNVPVSVSAFHNPELISRAHHDYNALQPTTREVFIQFDEALAIMQGFVATLAIPP